MSNEDKSSRSLLSEVKRHLPHPDSYAVIGIDGDDAVYMFHGDGDMLIKLLSGLEEHIRSIMEMGEPH